MEEITSLQNSKIKKWCALHQKKERDRQNRFLIEGEHLIQEALRADIVETIIYDETCNFDFGNTVHVTSQIMHKLSENVSAVHLIAVCRKEEKTADNMHRVILLDGVQDPGNLGTIIRTAVSFGYDAVYLSKDTVDVYNDKTIRSTQGALFHIPVIRQDILTSIQDLKKDGFRIFATSLHEAEPMSNIPSEDKMAFVLGNEGKGVREETLSLSDQNMIIEMQGFESLNVAIAGGIIMYHYQRKDSQ